MAETLPLGDFKACSESLGPGRRAVVWVRGCSIRCPGCATPEFIPAGRPEHAVKVADLAARIARAKDDHGIEGVSFSGGEPFEQAEALSALADECRKLGLSVISWSGHLIDDLKRDPARRRLLDRLDILIDGPFLLDRPTDAPLRGSANQTVHFLTDRYRPEDIRDVKAEFAVDGGKIVGTGVFDARTARTVLKLFGIHARLTA